MAKRLIKTARGKNNTDTKTRYMVEHLDENGKVIGYSDAAGVQISFWHILGAIIIIGFIISQISG